MDELSIRLSPEAVLKMNYTFKRIRWDEDDVKLEVLGSLKIFTGIEADATEAEVVEGARKIHVFGGTRQGSRDLWTAVYDKETNCVESFWTDVYKRQSTSCSIRRRSAMN